METTSSSNLPTSSRLPPAGQDSSEITETQAWQSNRYPSTLGNENNAIGTPRRFRVDNNSPLKPAANNIPINTCREEVIAPLGFEPEGSVSIFPYSEKWFTDFDSVLDHDASRRVFRSYLEQEKHGLLLDCWLACRNLKLMNPTESIFYRSVKEFYRRFVQNRDYILPVCTDLKERLAHGLRNHSLATVKLIADQIYSRMCEHYQSFLKSEYITNYYESLPPQHDLKPAKLLCSTQSGGEFCHYEHNSGSFTVKSSQYSERSNDLEKAQGLDAVTNRIKRGACQHDYHCHRAQPTQGSDTIHPRSDHQSDRMTSSENYTDSDRYSVAGTFRTEFSDHWRPRRDNPHATRSKQSIKDGLPDIPHFKPRTQELSKEGMKPLPPEEFMKVLTPLLERVLAEREREESQKGNLKLNEVDEIGDRLCEESSDTHVTKPHSSVPLQDNGSGCFGAVPSCYDRYSVTGTSVSGGSELTWRESHQKYKNGAKELASAVQHALRTELRECRCPTCISHRLPSGRRNCSEQYTYPKSWHGHDGQSDCSSVVTKPCSSCCRHGQHYHKERRPPISEHPPLTSSNLEQLGEPVEPSLTDHKRILEWMERNQKFEPEAPLPHPINERCHQPEFNKRHRMPVVYDTSRPVERPGHLLGNQPIASDPGMPPLPQPDTYTVLEETKRRLEDNSRGKSSKLRHKHQSRHSNHAKQHFPTHQVHPTHVDPAFSEKAQSTTSGNWTASDSASLVSRQVPSVVSSSIPSSASKMWHESKSDVRSDANTAKSHGSGSSKGRRKEGMTITYFLAHEPIPYRTNVPNKHVQLSQFKALLTKKGSFRYFFKTKSEDDGEMVYQEVIDENDFLPLYDGKIVGKVEKVE